MGIDNKLNNKIESFDKYRENLHSITRKIITNKSKSKENIKKFEESVINEIFFPDKLVTVNQKLSPQDIFFGVLFYGFNEIYISFERLKDLEVYISRFPNVKTPIAKINYLRFLIENYISEVYILKERLNKYLKKIRESYIEDRRYVLIRKTCDQLINAVEDSLENIITIRGSHTHLVRYEDRDIKRLESIFFFNEYLDELQKYVDDYIIPNFKNEYRKLRRKRKKILKDNNKKIKILLDYCFKKMLKIVFTDDDEISCPVKHSSIENRKKFFSKG